MAGLRHCDLRPKETDNNDQAQQLQQHKYSSVSYVLYFSLCFLLLFYIRTYHVNVPEQSFLK